MKIRIQLVGGGGQDARESPSTRFKADQVQVGSILTIDGILSQVDAHYPGTRDYDLCIVVKPLHVDRALALLVNTVQTLRREVKDLRGELDQLKTASAETAAI